VQYSAFSFSFQYPLISLSSSSSCLCLLPHLSVTSVFPSSIFLSVMCFRGQFLYRMRPIQVDVLFCIVYRILLSSLTLCNASAFFTWLVHLISIFLQPHTHQNLLGMYEGESNENLKYCNIIVLIFKVFILLSPIWSIFQHPSFSTKQSFDPD